MKKKEFKKPTVEVRLLETTAILAGSVQSGTTTPMLNQVSNDNKFTF